VPRPICIHRVPEIEPGLIPGFSIVAQTNTRDELLTAIGTLDVVAVVLDLDEPDAINTIVTALEIEPHLGIVGVTADSDVRHVIAAQRAGCTQFATRPLDAADLSVALRQAIDHRSDETPSENLTIATLSAAGGAGSTTIACHLAMELAQITESPTALFDLDFELGGVARGFDIDARYTIADLASAGTTDAILLENSAVKLASGVHVFARPRTVHEAHAIDVRVIPPILRAASQTYRYVLLDISHHLSQVTGAAIEHCDKLLLVVQLTVPNVDNARRIMDAISMEGIPDDRVEIVVNRYSKNMHSFTVEMVEERLRRKVLAVVPNDYEAVRDAIDTGKPLAKRNPVRNAIREIAVRLAGDDQASKRRGWLAKLVLGH
jgi:pilus assembly protein CpaE